MPPFATDSLLLPKSLLVLVLGGHLAFAAVLTGGALTAIVAGLCRRGHDPGGLASALLRRATLGPALPPLLIVSLAACLFCLRSAYPAFPFPAWLWGAVLGPAAAGLLLLYGYRRLRLERTRESGGLALLGLGGLALLAGAYLLLHCALALLLEPGEWPFLAGRPLLLFSWSGVALFGEFSALSLALAGLTAVRAGEEGESPPVFARTAALLGGTAFALWPALVLFDLYNLPRIGLSPAGLALAVLGILLAGAGLPASLRPALGEGTAGAFRLCAGLLLAVWLLSGQAAREQATAPVVLAGLTGLPLPAAVGGEEAGGKELFDQVCSRCHRFDRRLVGPPLDEVLPAYRGKSEALAEFIRNPVKKNPDYPAMPDLGLSNAEIEAVVGYLLERSGAGEEPAKEENGEKARAKEAEGREEEGKKEEGEEVEGKEPEGKREEGKAVGGKEVFDRICSTCHRFDQRLVGPPLAEVLPGYRGKPEALADFIRHPVKKNPDYPAMPDLGLSDAEIEAVAGYLLERVGDGGEGGGR